MSRVEAFQQRVAAATSQVDAERNKPKARWFVGSWIQTWTWNEDGRAEAHCRIVIDVTNDRLVAAQVLGPMSWNDATLDERNDLAKALFGDNKVSTSPVSFNFIEIDRLPKWVAAAADAPNLEPYSDGEVLGLDKDGRIVEWNARSDMPVDSGRSLTEFGLHNLREQEIARVGVDRDVWAAAVTEQGGQLGQQVLGQRIAHSSNLPQATARLPSRYTRFAFGTVSVSQERREELSRLGLIVGDYNEQAGHFFVCSDFERLNLSQISGTDIDLSKLRLRSEARGSADDYPATAEEIADEIAWCEFMLHAPVGSEWRKHPDKLVDIEISLHALRTDLQRVESDRVLGPADADESPYSSQIASLTAFLSSRGLRADPVPGAIPGDSAALVRESDGELLDEANAPEDVAAAAHLWSLLHDLGEGAISTQQFEDFGGNRCIELLEMRDAFPPHMVDQLVSQTHCSPAM